MKTYVVTEKQNVNSVRNGLVIEAADLAAAKRRASREQMFQGTVMTIESESGALLAIKQDGKWRDTE